MGGLAWARREREWPNAAALVNGGLDELFTINRLGLPGPSRRSRAGGRLPPAPFA